MEPGQTLEKAMTASLSRASIATLLLEKRKELRLVDETLKAQKRGYVHREKAFARREDNLRKKDLELQEALVLFNRFLKQNEAKRRQATATAEAERKQKEQFSKEIKQKRTALEQAKRELEVLKMRVESNEKYKLFLQKVHEENIGDFEERDHVMSRYRSLKRTHAELKEKRQRIEASCEKLARSLKDTAKGHHTLSLELNNECSTRAEAFERVMQDKNKAISNIEAREEYEAARRLQLGSIIASVDNVYLRCCRNEAEVMRKAATLALSKKTASAAAKKQSKEQLEKTAANTLKKLNIISRYLEDFASIRDMWRIEEKARKSTEAAKDAAGV